MRGKTRGAGPRGQLMTARSWIALALLLGVAVSGCDTQMAIRDCETSADIWCEDSPEETCIDPSWRGEWLRHVHKKPRQEFGVAVKGVPFLYGYTRRNSFDLPRSHLPSADESIFVLYPPHRLIDQLRPGVSMDARLPS